MRFSRLIARFTPVLAVVLLTAFAGVPRGFAHCDTMNGPVVLDAQHALESGDLAPVLKWVTAEDETLVRQAFTEARTARVASEPARLVADRYFLETVVRLHRASEGVPYTGIKPAHTPLNPAVALADDVLEHGDPEALVASLTQRVHDALLARFAAAHASRQHAGESTEAGRQYVADYVLFTHLAEFLQDATELDPAAHRHHAETTPAPHAH